MSDHLRSSEQSFTHYLHEGRRGEVRARFFDALMKDKTLLLHTATDDNRAMWHQICAHVFDAAFDRYDMFEHSNDRQYRDAKFAIIKEMGAVGLGHTLAAAELNNLSAHAVQVIPEIHAPAESRGRLHRAIRPDAQGRVRNPAGQFAKPGDPIGETVQDIILNTNSHARVHQAEMDRQKPLRMFVSNHLTNTFWRNSGSLQEARSFVNTHKSYTLDHVVYAMSEELLRDYPGWPTPNIPARRQPERKPLVAALKEYGSYDAAMRCALYKFLETNGIVAMHQAMSCRPTLWRSGNGAALTECKNDFLTRYQRLIDQVRPVGLAMCTSDLQRDRFEQGMAAMGLHMRDAMVRYVGQYRGGGEHSR